MLETEYYFSPAHGLALDVFYSLEVYDSPDRICFACYMTSFAENRTMLSINYKYYLPIYERGIYLSPYLRWRNWHGDLGNFVDESLNVEDEIQSVVSNGFSFGGTFGFHMSEKGRFDFTFYSGYGFYFYESYQSETNYTIRPEFFTEWRMGLNIGFRVYKPKVRND